MRYAITRDFVNFTEPQMWQDTGYSRIDSTVRKIGGYYYRFTKNEQGGAAGDYITTGKSIFLERSKVLTAPTTEASPGQDPNTGWQLLEQALLPFEGPETIKLNKDDELNTKDDDGYILLSDNFAYRAFMTTGAELSKTTWDNPMTKRYPDFNNEKKPVKAEPGAQGYITQGANGGLPDKVRHGAFVNVPESVLKVTKSWTAANPTHIEAVDSTTKAVYNAGTRELTATVTAADKGTLAGSVKFSAGDWSKTVKLDAEGKATVTLPASVSGTVAVAYDGYTDGLVNPSDTTVDGIEQGKVDLAELNKQIAAAEALKESDYTADSWAMLAAALKTAKAALAAENQGEVDTAAADLKTAIEALQKAPTNPGEGDGDRATAISRLPRPPATRPTSTSRQRAEQYGNGRARPGWCRGSTRHRGISYPLAQASRLSCYGKPSPPLTRGAVSRRLDWGRDRGEATERTAWPSADSVSRGCRRRSLPRLPNGGPPRTQLRTRLSAGFIFVTCRSPSPKNDSGVFFTAQLIRGRPQNFAP